MHGDGLLMLPLLLKRAGVEVHCVLSGRFQVTGCCMAPIKCVTCKPSPAPENLYETKGKAQCVVQPDLACD
jgi:hypothetical protein